MTTSLNNLGFTSCIFTSQDRTKAKTNNQGLFDQVSNLLPKLNLEFQLKQASDQPGKFAVLSTNHEGQEYKFFLFKSKENEMETIKIVPESDGFNLDTIQGEFSTNLHNDLQKIMQTIHKGSSADLTFSIDSEFSPNNPQKALQQAQYARHLIVGKSLAKAPVNRMETLDDGSVEIVTHDNPGLNKPLQALTNMPKIILEGIMNLKNGVHGIFGLAS